MSYHRLPFIRKPSQALDDEIELLGPSQDKSNQTQANNIESNSLLSPFRSQIEAPELVEDDDVSEIQGSRSWRIKHRTGWRFGVICGCASASAVFLINLIVTIYAAASHAHAPGRVDDDSGRLTLFYGSCSKAQHLNIVIHFIINALSTVLLSASNYCMQCLSAPTRTEVDRAHAKKAWADIGVPSIRNLRLIERRKVILWGLLSLSSLPLHLLYNSAVINSIAAWEYQIILANDTFVQDDLWQQSLGTGDVSPQIIQIHDTFFSGLSPQRLDTDECISTYGQSFQTARGDVVLVYENGINISDGSAWNEGGGVLNLYNTPIEEGGADSVEQFSWICADENAEGPESLHLPLCSSEIPHIKTDAGNWSPYFGAVVSYCLSKPQIEMCEVNFSLPIAIVVILLNGFKAIIMAITAFTSKEQPLVTVGDGVASFLRNKDTTVSNMCLSSRMDFGNKKNCRRLLSQQALPQLWVANRTRWFRAASKMRWVAVITLYLVALITCASLLGYGTSVIDPHPGFGYFWNLGLGAVNTNTMISWTIPSQGISGVVGNTLVANIPQVILSFIYFTYNGLFTCMLLAREYSDFTLERKGLRVSGVPKGHQRSSYFLQLPYRFSLPLMALSGLLHWLVSESIFLVSINVYDTVRGASDGNIMTCGYSPAAILLVILAGIAMVATILVFGSFRLKPGIPVASSCSIAIAAACHPGSTGSNSDISTSELQWGVIDLPIGDKPGHCGFSNESVGMPVEGPLYA
ncbi:hypothetical protein EV356DRAFT_362818 [Viridothelium virens]|uniref:DUF6536 domain-containing protein n=1 Tax=Viridothelium virens TaxID=1048519 RepID=A0A6A6HJC4_VIRVR|nr:hypothetical protein EV356DRAFT_362818 [Viridothelium virens]